MSPLEKNPEFHESLACLFYAIAAADNSVRIDEKKKIKDLVDQQWSYSLEDVDSREVIFSTLRELLKDYSDKERAFSRFREFFLNHRILFSEPLKRKIMDSINKIATAFAGRNKSESVMISRLHFLFQN